MDLYRYSVCRRRRSRAGFRNAFQSGFTLGEVLVVALIISVLALITAPTWFTAHEMVSLKTAQDRAYEQIRLAQTQAERSNIPWQVSFQEVNGMVQGNIHAANTLPDSASWTSFNAGVQIDSTATTLSQTNGIYRVQFNHQGRVNGQMGRITFKSSSGSRIRRCVFVSTLLGALRRDADAQCAI